MKKKLLSKRGFTLVECLVAIVIFTIMALMVSMMYSMSLTTYANSRKIDTDLSAQEHDVAIADRYMYDDTKKETDTIDLTFDGMSKIEYPYEAKQAGSYNENLSSVLLNYAVSNVTYADSAQQDNQGNGNGNGSIPSDIDAKIYGSAEIKGIYLYDLKTDSVPNAPAGSYCYSFEFKIDDDGYRNASTKNFRQVKFSLNSPDILGASWYASAAEIISLGGSTLRVAGGTSGNRDMLDGANGRIVLVLNTQISGLEDLKKYFGDTTVVSNYNDGIYTHSSALEYVSQSYTNSKNEIIDLPGVYGYTSKTTP